MDEPNKTQEPAVPETPQKAQPQRRVGSLTLGVCLIAAGIFFLCYHFVPGFDVQLVLEIAPAVGLVLLGCEVLFFATRPERWKYDFVSVFVCLVLMACCFGLSLLPAVWDEISPDRWQTANRLEDAYTTLVYDAIRKDAPDIALRDVSSDLNLYTSKVDSLTELQPGDGHLTLTVNLYGPYDSTETFAADCRRVLDAVQTQSTRPDVIDFCYEPVNAAQDTLDSGSLRRTERYELNLYGIAQQDWTAEQMAGQTEVYDLTDEENDLPEEEDDLPEANSNEEITEQNT